MKKILYFMLLLITTSNFSVFVFGLIFSEKAAVYERTQQENYILDSALTLAIQAREDSRIMMFLEEEFKINNRTAGYTIRQIDKDMDYIKVFIKKNNEILFREYQRRQGSKPVIIPRIEGSAVATPSPTVTPETIVEIPEIKPTPAPAEWTKIK